MKNFSSALLLCIQQATTQKLCPPLSFLWPINPLELVFLSHQSHCERHFYESSLMENPSNYVFTAVAVSRYVFLLHLTFDVMEISVSPYHIARRRWLGAALKRRREMSW